MSIKLNHPLTCDVMMCAIGFSHARTFPSFRFRFLILSFFFDFSIFALDQLHHRMVNSSRLLFAFCLLCHPRRRCRLSHPTLRELYSRWKFLPTSSATLESFYTMTKLTLKKMASVSSPYPETFFRYFSFLLL